VVPSDRTGVSYSRSTNPHIALENNYPNEFHIDVDYEPQLNNDEWLKQYDIIHYHRTLGNYEQMEQLNQHLKDLGIISIMDLDDHWAPGTHHPAYHLIKNAKLDEKIVSNLRTAENVTTTTDIFAKEMSKYNKNVHVLPNAVDPTEKQFTPNLEPNNGRLRIGWLGGSSHLKDLEILKGLVGQLGSDIDKVQFVLCGFDLRGTHTEINKETGQQTTRQIKPKESVWFEYEKIFTNDYKSVSPEYKDFLMSFKQEEYPNVANEAYRRVWTKPISTYASNYNLFDVSLAPIEENLFNKVKSQLKVIEAGFHKKAIIAQEFGPYEIDVTSAMMYGGGFDLTANGILIPKNKNHKNWVKAVKALIHNPELVTTLQTNLHNTIKDTYSMNKVTEDRRNLYHSLVAKKNEKNVSEKLTTTV
jgi:glycosyltransferase involved in cell wall biosynthesis